MSVSGLTQFDEGMDKVEARAKKAAEQVAKVGQALLGMGAALTAVTALMVRAAAEDQKLEQRLSALLGSTEAGAKAFQTLEKRARQTGAATHVLTDAVQAMNIYFEDSPELIMKLLPRFQDLAAYMGQDMPTAIAAFGRAMTGGASDTVTMRGPLLALVKDFAKAKLGISDITKMELPAFRRMLLDFMQSPEAKFGDFAAKSAKTFSGQLNVLRQTADQVAAKFGDSLLPVLTSVVAQFVKVAEWLRKLPPELQAIVTWTTSTVGVFATLAGGLMALLPRILSTIMAVKSLGVAVLATGATITGIVAVIGAAAAATYIWTDRINKAEEAANKLARSQNDVADAIHKTKKGTVEWYEAWAAHWQSIVDTGIGSKNALDKLAASAEKYRAIAAKMRAEQTQGAIELTEAMKKQLEVEFELAQLHETEMARRLSELGKTPEAEAGAEGVGFDWQLQFRQAEEAAQKLKAVLADLNLTGRGPLTWTDDELAAFNKAMTAEGKQIDIFQEMAAVAGAAGEAIGRAFADMAKGVHVSTADMLKQIGLLIAKMMILIALKSWTGGISDVVKGVISGVFNSFDSGPGDTWAWRQGADFVRQFGAGVNSMLGNGLTLPQMQPAAIGGMGGVAFDVHVHEPGPDTYVKVVRRGISQMSDNEAFGLYRNKLGRASDRWDGR